MPNTPKLVVGDIIQVLGYVMLQGLDDGEKYELKSIQRQHGIPVYNFKKQNRRKRVVHFCKNVDLWIRDPKGDLNYIRKVGNNAQSTD